jgi:hypothetical protein
VKASNRAEGGLSVEIRLPLAQPSSTTSELVSTPVAEETRS